jgi:hypothetical protein
MLRDCFDVVLIAENQFVVINPILRRFRTSSVSFYACTFVFYNLQLFNLHNMNVKAKKGKVKSIKTNKAPDVISKEKFRRAQTNTHIKTVGSFGLGLF